MAGSGSEVCSVLVLPELMKLNSFILPVACASLSGDHSLACDHCLSHV